MPSLSIDGLYALNDRISSINIDDPEAALLLIDELFSTPIFREAIFTSSMDLYSRLQTVRMKEHQDAQEVKGFLVSFYKYYSRMSHRCTPYGIFAGLSAGTVTKEISSFSFEREKYKPVFQFNIQTITQFLRNFNATDPSVIDRLSYCVNNTLYIIKDKMFFVEKTDQNGYQVSNLTSITLNVHIERILERARLGATLPELAATIELPGTTEAQKTGFVNSLITSQVLISELWPGVSNGDFMQEFLEKAAAKHLTNAGIRDLQSVNTLFKSSTRIEDIGNIRHFLAEQSPESIINVKDFYRVDLFYKMKANTMNEEVIRKIKAISGELMMVSSTDTPLSIDTFKRNFHTKYENREIPLVKAIDPNYGVGYALAVNGIAEFTPIVDGIPIMGETDSRYKLNRKMDIIRQKAKKAYFGNGTTVVKIDEDILAWIAEIKENGGAFFNRAMTSVYSFGSLTAASIEELDKGNFKFRPTQINSPYAGRLLSRFLHGDALLDQSVKEIARREQEANPDVILAEAVYIPDGKYANINLTTRLRDYEITYSASSQLDAEHQINVNDLTVSLRNGRVVLRSIKLNKEVIPCVTSTYDVSFANPIYQFLSDVSYQYINHGFEWSWGIYDMTEPFLPRIEYKNFILHRARWFIPRQKIDYKSPEALNTYFEHLIATRSLPQYVIIPEGDNELLIDLSNPVCRYILAKEINRTNTVVQEFLNTRDQCFIRDGENAYTNEVIIPFGTAKPMYPDSHSSEVNVEDEIRRVFPPGSEWLFVKIYSGTKLLEELLTEVVGPFAQKLTADGTIDQWFFLRYDDPGYHLRLRVHRSQNEDNSEWYQILEKLQRLIHDYIGEEHAVKITVDTYQREIERYGARTMEPSERIFWADSIATANFLNLISGNDGEELRWKFALVSIDRLLNDFGFTLTEKRQLLSVLSANFFSEFTMHSQDKGKLVSRHLRERYRKFKADIAGMLREELRDPELTEGYDCFEQRSRMIEMERLIPESNTVRNDLLASYIHMAMNRMFVVNQRKHELVIYYFLNEFYSSVIAQQKNSTNEYADARN